jgi:hypothetical protein
VFGRLTVIALAEEYEVGKPAWICSCSCQPDKTVIVLGSDLRRGGTKSCGCIRREKNLKDLTGMKFGRLTVIERTGSNKQGRALWKCKCDCGNDEFVITIGTNLLKGDRTSCGCLNIEKTIERSTTHGGSKTRLYNIYRDILKRCYNPKFKHYQYYGGKGVSVCKEWIGESGFINFRVWSMMNGYKDDLTLDRINGDGNYEPNNCRWVSMKVQNNNKKNNHFITINGETKTITQWSEEYNLEKGVLQKRIRSGWEESELLKPSKNITAEKQSGEIGVIWNKKAQRWQVFIKRKYIGCSSSLEEAIKIKKHYLENIKRGDE